MSTLSEIEAVIPNLSPEELVSLERLVRAVRQRKKIPVRCSVFDLPPLDLGKIIVPSTLSP